MEKLRGRLQLSFSSKVLLPVVTIMVLLLSITVWTVNRRLTRQFRTEAARNLAAADAVFQNSQRIFAKNLLLRYHNLVNEPRYRASFQSGDLPTLREQIKDLPADQGVDLALFSSADGELLAIAKRDPLIPIADFEAGSKLAIRQALQGEEKVDTIRVAERLFDVVSVPVSGIGGNVIGALTVGSEIGDTAAREFSLVTHSQIVLLANGRVIASTVPNTEARPQFPRLFSECLSGSNQSGVPKDILLGVEHYFCAAGSFASISGDAKLGYLLLTSYEQPLRVLQSTQQMLLLVSSLGILVGIGIVWFLVRKVTEPLRALRDSAEAVGRGDFSRRVQVQSADECGELADAFNQMTENLKSSRELLETTVNTLKTTQAQLVQSEKLSGIGEFVAGVAHELNNPLTSVMGFSELLKRANDNPQHQRHLEMIHKSALRCQKIVQSLLSFARRHQPERKLSSINDLVEAAVEILAYQMRTNNIEVITHLSPDLPEALVDPHQVQQVFLNIINNARQAIEGHRPMGWVRISTEHQGDHAHIVFEDNGPGIPEANLSKVFDPFFTTKEPGKGTGLGLSLCYGIVKEHGGTIAIRSKPGEGATFVIELPLALEAAVPESSRQRPGAFPQRAGARSFAPGEGLGKKILIVDDEESILHMVRDALTEHGYQVDFVQDGETALRRLSETPYDLTLCDLKMPGLTGQQVYERLRVANPALSKRMIFITGDVINDRAQQFLQDSKKVCLTKPFSLAEFRAAIVKALAE